MAQRPTAEDIFKEACKKDVVDGDIPAAIQIYDRNSFATFPNRALFAQSLFQLGESYERLNQPSKSREYFQRIVDQFKDQSGTWARAANRLAAISDGRKRSEIKTPYNLDGAFPPARHQHLSALVSPSPAGDSESCRSDADFEPPT